MLALEKPWKARFASAVLVSLAVISAAPANVTFNLTPAAGMDPEAVAAFQEAADRWSARLANPITVNISIGFGPLSGQILGSTNTTKELGTYSAVRSALAAAATSADDQMAVASLPAGPAFNMLINRTYNSPNGTVSPVPYVDSNANANNLVLQLTTANAKVLGLRAANDPEVDATITFSSSFNWDFHPGNGIASDARDFVGAATHEIGHALGFVSGVDTLDGGGWFEDSFYMNVSPIDLFRFSAESAALGVIDWTADTRLKYFSLDSGATDLGGFATGVKFGDGRNASHWREGIAPDPAVGVMDPTLALGELMTVSGLDERAFDVIGYQVVPEPATALVLLLGGWRLLGRARRR